LPEKLDTRKIWNQFLDLAKDKIPKSSFQTWIRPANLKSISLENQEVVLEVKNEFSKNLVIQNYYKIILKIFEELTQVNNLDLVIRVNKNLQIKSKDCVLSLSALTDSKDKKDLLGLKKEQNSNLEPRFSFDNFIVGPHNQFAHAVALSVAHNWPRLVIYNPFFIYGDVGLGKTHLMQSIGNYVQKKAFSENQNLKILYITAEKFLNDLIENMKRNQMNNFRAKYRSVNLLLIDDIQFIEGKEATQEEFFHTFNSLKERNNQIILTSDRSPSAIPKLEKRLQSRFEAGLIVDIQHPSYEARVAIIQKKSLELNLELCRESVELLSQGLVGNIRTIEGVLNKIEAYSRFNCIKPNPQTVKEIIELNKPKFESQQRKNKERTIEEISQIVSEKLKIDLKKITDPENTQRDVLEARHLCITLCRWVGVNLTKLKEFFNKQNSSLLNSIKRIEKKSKEDPEFSKFVKDLHDQVKEL